MDRHQRCERLNHRKIDHGLILIKYVYGHLMLAPQGTLQCEHFTRMLVEVKIVKLRAEVGKVERLHSQSMLLRGFNLKFTKMHKWTTRRPGELLRLVKRNALDTARGTRRMCRTETNRTTFSRLLKMESLGLGSLHGRCLQRH